MAAEMRRRRGDRPRRRRRFNEAAANGRGNTAPDGYTVAGVTSFNEAAANGRGNPDPAPDADPAPPASMRPRRMAAEIWKSTL